MNIIAVVVLYRCRMDQSPTIASLVRSWEHCPDERLKLKLVIYDNNPESHSGPVALPFDHQYIHDAANGGLAAAYNYAVESDPGDHYQWLLLLDQDSNLPDNFIAIVAEALSVVEHDNGVVAVVPQVTHDSTPISPALVKRGGGIRPIRNSPLGVCHKPVTAINSGTMLRKLFVSEIGGFNRQFRLDYLDHWLFAEINRRGRKVYITGAIISHDLSIGNRARPVSPERYRSVLQAETLFYRVSKNRDDFVCHMLALAIRAGRQYLLGDRELSRLTLKHLFNIAASR